MKKYKIINNLFYYKFNDLNKKMQKDLKVIFNNENIKYLTLSLKKWEKIKEKHINSPEEKEKYIHIHNSIPLFMNKGYSKKGLKIQTVDGEINLVIDSAIKDLDKIFRIRIALMNIDNTIIIKSFYITFPIIK